MDQYQQQASAELALHRLVVCALHRLQELRYSRRSQRRLGARAR